MPLSLDQFAQQLTASGLLPREEFEALLGKLASAARPATAEQLARLLVREEKLTAYQAQQVYTGKGKSLVLGNYVVLDKLGQGGMGMVLKARHRVMNRIVALKVIAPQLTKTPEALRRFQREVQAAARLTHPNIVIAHDADQAGGTHFLVMEYIEGTNLSALVKNGGPLPLDKALHCVVQAARGLDYAHQHGVVHRDIKPSNLLVDRQGQVKILDMGLARLDLAAEGQDELTGTGQVMGTIDYMAPEQGRNAKSADQRADIYSLGATLWYLVTGRPLFGGASPVEKLLAHQTEPIPSLTAALHAESRRIGAAPAHGGEESAARTEAVFRKLVAKSPADRYRSMAEVVAQLQQCLRPEASAPQIDPGACEDSRLDAFLRAMGSQTGSPPPRSAAAVAAPAATVPAEAGDPDATIESRSHAQHTLPTAKPSAPARPAARPPRAAKSRAAARQQVLALVIGGVLAALGLLVVGAVLWLGTLPERRAADVFQADAEEETPLPQPGQPSDTPPRSDREEAVIRRIYQLGGKIEFDETRPGKPAIKVNLGIGVGNPARPTDDDLQLVAELKTLQSLRFVSNNVSDTGLAHVKGLRELDHLEFYTHPESEDDGGITDAGLKHLADLPKLSAFYIRGNGFTDDGVAAALQTRREYSFVYVYGKQCTGRWLTLCDRDTVIGMLYLYSATQGDEMLRQVLHLPKVQQMRVWAPNVTDQGLKILEQHPGLSLLEVTGTKVTAAGADAYRAARPQVKFEWDGATVEPIDLLKLVDVEKDWQLGEYRRDGDAIITGGWCYTRLAIPYLPPEEYRLEVDVQVDATHTDSWVADFIVGLVHHGQQFAVVVNDHEAVGPPPVIRITGIKPGVDTDYRAQSLGPVITKEKSVSLRFIVLDDRITCSWVTGVLGLAWHGDMQRLSLDPRLAVAGPPTLFLGAYHSRYRVTALRLTPVRGQGKIVPHLARWPLNLTPQAAKLPGVRTWTIMPRRQPGAGHAAWSPDGSQFAVALYRGGAWVFNAATAQPVGPAIGAGDESIKPVEACWSSDGMRLATNDSWNGFSIWDTSNWKRLGNITTNTQTLAWSADSRTLATCGSASPLVHLWDATKLDGMKRELSGHTAGVSRIAWSRDGRRIASWGNDKTIRVWDVASSSTVAQVTLDDSITGLAISPDGTRLATTRGIWNADTGKLSFAWQEAGGMTWYLGRIAFSHDGALVAGASAAGRVKIWEAATGNFVRDLEGFGWMVAAVDWTPDHRLLAASADGTVRVWTRDGEPLGAMVFLPESRYLAVSPQGHYHGSEGIDDDIVFVATTDAGEELLLTPAEFAQRFGWKNEPRTVSLSLPAAE